MSNSKQYRFHALVPLWGSDYIDGARKFLFSSLLAPGNLSADIPIDLHIIGKKSEQAIIFGCPKWQSISALCNTKFDGLDDSIFDEMSYFAMSHCYDHALSKYEAPESVFIFLTGDIVLARDTFSCLKSLIDDGYRAAMVPGPRVRGESIEHLRRVDGVLVAECRDLMRAMWEKPLALTEGYQVMDNGRNKCPMHYYWRVGQYSTLARNMMMHPLMVWPDDPSARVVCPAIGVNAASAALDQGYMRYAVERPESIYVACDSDKLSAVSISSDDHFSNDIMIKEGYTPEQEKGIFSAFCNDYHFWYGAHDLFLKGENVEPEAWGPAQQKAAALMKTKMDFISGVIASDPTAVALKPASDTQTPRRPLSRRVFSGFDRLRNLIRKIPYLRPFYNKVIRYLFPSLGRLETSVQNLSLQISNLAGNLNRLSAGHKHLALGHNDLAVGQNQAAAEIRAQVAELTQKVAELEKVTKGYFEQIVAPESSVQTVALQIDRFELRMKTLASEVKSMSSVLQTAQQFLTEVFASYRWLENCDPESSITCQVPLGHHSALRARYIYKDAFYVAIDYLISNQILGPVLEFGSRSGFTSRCLAETMAERNYPGKLYLFDSFEGLPEITSEVDLLSPEVSDQRVWFKGAMSMPDCTVELIARDLHKFMQPHQFEIVKGFFSETLPKALPEEPVAMVHIDCDLYQSATEVLEALNEKKLLQNGAIILFDDYNTSKADPKRGERRALNDFLQRNKVFSVSPFMSYNWHGQAFFLHVDESA